MILVVGATGRLGGAVAAKLKASDRALRATYRRAAQAVSLRALGLAPVKYDMRRAADLTDALNGVTTVFTAVHSLTASAHDSIAQVDTRGHKTLIDAAAERGIRRFVYTSAMGAAAEHPAPLWRAKAEVERHLISSGLDYTILRPSAFMDFHAHELIGRSVLAGKPARILGDGNAKRNFVSVEDVATVAALALTTDGFSRQVLDIGGPDNLTDREIAEFYAALAGSPARIQALPPSALRLLSLLLNPFHAGVARILRLPLQVAGRADLTFDPSHMPALLSRQPMSLEEFAHRAVAKA
jgi:uncharacterized protein YbjT (DUF2867 family)